MLGRMMGKGGSTGTKAATQAAKELNLMDAR